ncbi:MAG: 50S ribosomal protein L30 [Candidatus Korarchaeota archaeon]|nr:50S ribosomal protein L30 [Thermoproteota archaeon]
MAVATEESRTLPKPEGQWIAVIRIRGRVNTKEDVEWTLKLLRLNKPNHCVVIRYTPSIRGMLIKAQHKIAWGEIDFETFYQLLKERGRIIGDKSLTDDIVKEKTNGRYQDIKALAEAIWRGEITFRDLEWFKPVFRLHPPRKGYKRSTRKLYQERGALGYWGPKISDLLRRMF